MCIPTKKHETNNSEASDHPDNNVHMVQRQLVHQHSQDKRQHLHVNIGATQTYKLLLILCKLAFLEVRERNRTGGGLEQHSNGKGRFMSNSQFL